VGESRYHASVSDVDTWSDDHDVTTTTVTYASLPPSFRN
jgi:hypothetical protein